ncbi:MAG: LPS export ABC transporter permease LptF [Gammaproteobacteria bacterium]|nr:LPS export ABC transporter permease LptF [Gammaproteobacteria bacterium]
MSLLIIHRAFIKEVLQTCTAVTAILFSIFLVTRLVGFLREAAEGDIPINSVFLLLLLKMITYLDILIPLVLFISTLLVMGRWIRDNELTIINACGIGMAEFLKPAMVLFAIVGSVVALFAMYLSPLSAEVGRSMEYEFRTRTDATGITPGVFTETRGGTGVYFVEGYDQDTDTFQNIFVYNGNDEEGLVVANSGYKTVDVKTNDDFLVLKHGTQYRGSAGSSKYVVMDFETYAVRLRQRAKNNFVLPVKARPTLDLLKEEHHTAIGELHWRISKVIMLPILLIFALSFSSITYRSARFPGMFSALLIYFTYSNVLGLGVALIRKGSVNPHLALWVIHLCFLAVAIYMFRRRCLSKPLIPGLSSA